MAVNVCIESYGYTSLHFSYTLVTFYSILESQDNFYFVFVFYQPNNISFVKLKKENHFHLENQKIRWSISILDSHNITIFIFFLKNKILSLKIESNLRIETDIHISIKCWPCPSSLLLLNGSKMDVVIIVAILILLPQLIGPPTFTISF